MTAEDFVRELASLAPSAETLRGIGLSVAEAESFRAAYTCRPWCRSSSLMVSNEMLDLTSRWNVSDVEIGMVRLFETPSTWQGRDLQVGLVEADPLLIRAGDSQLVVEEFGTSGHCLWNVAGSPGRFLDALVRAAAFLRDRAVGTVDSEDFDAAKVAANKCAGLAGGSEYAEFYFMLLGAES